MGLQRFPFFIKGTPIRPSAKTCSDVEGDLEDRFPHLKAVDINLVVGRGCEVIVIYE